MTSVTLETKQVILQNKTETTWKTLLDNQKVMTRKERFQILLNKFGVPIVATISTSSALMLFS